jgi:ribose/xylose/arabinose/galactoside ABC-type transport system permease subunit
VWFALAVVVAGIVLLRCHALGRQLYARGGNEHLAATIGIRTRWLSVLSFAIGGATVGLAAILWAAEYNTIQSNLGEGFALQVIAAAVIGGANIMGGSGSAFGTAIAALLIGVIYNGMVMLGIHSDWQKAVFGVLIVAAVLLDKLLRHLAEE